MAALAHVDPLSGRTDEGKHLGAHEDVEEDDIARLQQRKPAQGQEPRIAGPGAHEVYRATLDLR
jgi:hypothetical protein